MINLLKVWILNWSFIQKEIEACRKDAIDQERPKVFALAQKDLIETFQDDVEKRAEELANEKLAAMLSPINDLGVLTQSPKQNAFFLGGRLIEPTEMANLKAEADYLAASEIWKLLIETPKQLAYKAMFIEGENLDAMRKGRSMLYTLDTQTRIVKLLQGYTQPVMHENLDS